MDPCKQELRIAQLESDTKVNCNSINILIDQLKELTQEVKWLIRLTILTLLSVSGFFVGQFFRG